ncbi:hypothetical protein E5676_scaffold85G00730 [Cucumis melo var. makuwa]|uniref:Uncharacterized protein n=1 Tax=Cucumis melo var. makuwa TaxID=1194695 RepID=A0A5D3BCI6_CUCMM|nr:hypothetical protein E6C27_scaffold278G00500 [Cucumis melo var. makuwa]TYJ97550.1 hypothetical protein E5676_scaffold85G00730 [Cucumis melo var. makuwa]
MLSPCAAAPCPAYQAERTRATPAPSRAAPATEPSRACTRADPCSSSQSSRADPYLLEPHRFWPFPTFLGGRLDKLVLERGILSRLKGRPCCLKSTPFLTFRIRQVNLQHVMWWRELLWPYDGCRDGECNDDLSVMLYADAMCMYTAIRHGYRYDSSDSTGSSHPEDQSYVPTGAHVARVRERARDWVEDEARAKASWRATRSDRGGP